MSYFFTSESVSEGHPDKVSDQISDAVLDDILTHDPDGRVACETFCATGMVVVGGEITTTHYVDIPHIVRQVVSDIGYSKGEYRFDFNSISVLSCINKQSPDIAMGVDTGGAGDQGIMFGYANNETDVFMPMPIYYAHKLVQKLADIRKHHHDVMPYLRPDSKSQVTVEYDDNAKPKRVDAVVISTQHDDDVSQETIREDVIEKVIKRVIPEHLLDDETKFHINPTGKFVIGGPHGDTGLTGRKIIVDTYGGRAPHGGGAFSGKDPSKVDRSATYAARHIAKNIVAAGLADECLLQFSYAIGVAEPVSVYAYTHGTGKLPDKELARIVKNEIDMTPKGIIERLQLKRPIYRKTSNYGHFGRDDADFTWEKLDLKDNLTNAIK
ncbi:MAG: methionine adenosyltransferase [Ignavibacteriae bacterium]|nr:methionine adenosyltransferase [Ignavibacteriota bacterium]MCB9243280.1 methionine adenosyltransferase [Ignavibacteriales bacterium]